MPPDGALGHVGADEPHLALAVLAQPAEERRRAGGARSGDDDGDRFEAHARDRCSSARFASNQALRSQDLVAAAGIPHLAPAGQPALAAVDPVDLVAHHVAVGDDVEERDPVGTRRGRTRRREGAAARPVGRPANPNARPGSSGAAAPRSWPPTRRRRGAAPAGEVPVDQRDGSPSRKITFGGKMSLWQITRPASTVPAAASGRSCHPGGGRSPPGHRASAAAAPRARAGRRLPAERRECRLAVDEREHLPPALVAAERARRPVEADRLEVPQQRVDAVGVRADRTPDRVADANDDLLADVDVAADERCLVQRGSPPSSGSLMPGRCGLPRAAAAAAPSRPRASRASSGPSSRPDTPRSRDA